MAFKLQDGFQISHDDPGFGVWTDPRDGQEYPYKKIGTQTWMLTNLNYGGGSTQFVNASNSTSQSEGHAWRYNNEANYLSWPFDRGALYMWDSLSWAVPEGWHIPSASELDTFKSWVQSKYGSSNGYPTKAIKTTTHWNTVKDGYGTQYPANGTDDFGFSLVASGYANCSSEGSTWYFYGSKDQYDSGSLSYIWISDPYNAQGGHKYWSVGGGYTSVYSWSYNGQTDQYVNRYACAVRLIQDAPAQFTEPEIESISITIPSSGASDSKLVTEKAVKDYVDSQGGGMQNPMTTAGDIIVGGTNGAPDRMALGTTGKILTSTQNGIGWSSGISENATVTIESTGSSNSLILKGQGGASLASGGDISIDAHGGTNHAILKSTTDDGQGGDIVNTSLDIYQGGATLIAGSSQIYLKSDSNNACSSVLIDGNTVVAKGNYIGSDRYGDTFSIGDNTGPSLTSQNSITIGTSGVSPISLEASSGTYTASLNLSAASTAGTDSAILSVNNGTYTVGLGISTNGATLSSDAGPITISSVRSPIILSAPTVQIPNMSEVDWTLNWNACLEVLDTPIDTRYIASYFVNRTGNMDAIILGCYNTHRDDSVTVATYDSTGEETILGSFTVTENKENPIIVPFTNPLPVTFGQNVRFGFCFTAKHSDTRIYCNNMLTQSWDWRVRTFSGNSGDITWSNGTLVSTLPSIGFHFA